MNRVAFANGLRSIARLLWSKTGKRMFFAIFLFLIGTTVFSLSFARERSARRAEAEVIVVEGGRDPAETRGIMNYLIQHRNEDRAPALIPQSMWDNSACAAAVIEMVNFLQGGHRLRVTDAWTLQRDNPGRVRLIYDREASHDFNVGDEHITEQHDRTWWFSRLRQFKTVGEGERRTAARIYILGYRYHQTLADPRILEARRGEHAEQVGLNSHVAVLLGREDGEWYVYHFFHRPDEPNVSHQAESPLRVDSLSGPVMTSQFDMVRVWEVVGPSLPLNGTRVRIENPARPYTAVRPYLGLASRFGDRASFFVDTAMMGLLGDNEQFPRVVRLETPRSPTRAPVAIISDTSTNATAAHASTGSGLVHQPRERLTGHRTISRRHLPPPQHGRTQRQTDVRRVRHGQHPRASR